MSDTIAALSTANGEAAVAMLRISGPRTTELFSRSLKTKNLTPRRMFRAKYFSSENEFLDDVLAVYFPAPASYTGDDCGEIYCHGNPFITQKILADLFANECRPAMRGEFTRRAFMNNKMDLSQAEAVALVIGARGERALCAAQRQLSGELGRRIADFSERLINACALVEAYIDFPEDDLPDEDKNILLSVCRGLSSEMETLAQTSKYSALLNSGINTVIAGAPNAGKSSLLNAMLGKKRAIVSDVAGTTRDFISEKILIDGYALNIVDTAGLRHSDNGIEKQGVELAREKILSADIRLFTVDTSLPPDSFDTDDDIKISATEQNTIFVLNKIDLPNSRADEWLERFSKFACAKVSCSDGNGVDNLKHILADIIKKYHIRAAADDILVSARHADALRRASNALAAASERLAENAPSELPASDIRYALDAIGEIVGKSDNEAVLDRIFSTFCIGK